MLNGHFYRDQWIFDGYCTGNEWMFDWRYTTRKAVDFDGHCTGNDFVMTTPMSDTCTRTANETPMLRPTPFRCLLTRMHM